MRPLRVAIVDDHELLLEALGIALAASDEFEIALAVRSIAAFKELARADEIDVVVTDLALADGSGTEVALYAAEKLASPVLLITGQGDREGVQAAIDSGCVGFVSKGEPINNLTSAIKVAATGGTVFPAALLRTAITGASEPRHGITEREMAVLRLLAQGMAAQQIADVDGVSVHTVRNHIRALLSKLHARSQLEAVVLAVREGLVSIE